MNETLQLMLTELQQLTAQIAILIKEENTEPALELIERRLVILMQLKKISDTNEQLKITIQDVIENIIPVDKNITTCLLIQQEAVAEKLLLLDKANKANQAYQKI